MTAILIEENIKLAPLTTLEVGGAARFFLSARTEVEIIAAVNFAKERDLPLFVLGGGSNVLIADAGFDGLVLRINLRGIEFRQDRTGVFATAAAGEDWENFVRLCVEKNLAGVECLSGIPGTIGASPIQNIGAYGQEVAETIVSVRVLERGNGEIFDLTNADCGFAYRASIFNSTRKNEFVVLSVTFRLAPGGAPKIAYRDLQNYFAADAAKPDLKAVREAVLVIRRAKSMVLSLADPNSKSAGSFFKNPIVAAEKFAEVEKMARKLNLIAENQTIPQFPAGDNLIKIPAAWLIEKSGFGKGYVFNHRVGISSNHTLAIVNRGAATAADVLNLTREIQAKVKETFGIALKPEPIFVGFGNAS